MIVGTTNIDYSILKSFVGKPEDLVAYVESLVPTWARHIPAIVYNQRFYIAIHLRKVLTIPYKPRMELVNALVKDINIQGVMSNFTAITDIISVCDKTALVEMLKMRLADNERPT